MAEFQAKDKPNNWFLEWLRAVFYWLGKLSDTAPVLYWLILIGCILLLALIVGHIVVTVARTVRFGREPGGRQSEERLRLSEGCRVQAEAFAAAGAYTEAVRSLFLSLVYAYDEAGKLPFRPSLTNHEYLQFFSDRPSVGRDLSVFVELLDANWYGQHPTSTVQYADCLARFHQLRGQRM